MSADFSFQPFWAYLQGFYVYIYVFLEGIGVEIFRLFSQVAAGNEK